MSEAIRFCITAGCRTFCFGRTEPENDGLLQFKRGWGAGETVLEYYRLDLRKNAFEEQSSSAGSFYNSVLRHVPVPLLKLAGTISYRHGG